MPYAKVPRLLPRKTMRVMAGPPVDLSAFRSEAPTPSVLKKATIVVIEALTALLAELRGEEPPAERFDLGKANLPSTGNPYKKRLRRSRS